MAHDPRIVRLSQQGNSIRVVARNHEDVGSWLRDLSQHGMHPGTPVDIDVGLEDVFFYLTLQQQGSITQF
jgi:ABC-2 type transport system ATP-binding protein